MDFKIKSSSSRNLIEGNIEDNDILYSDYDKYVFFGDIQLIDTETEKTIATIEITYYDEDKILNDNMSLAEISDMICGDEHFAICTLLRSRLYKAEIDEEAMFVPLVTCYISRVFVYPEYRNMGFGTYIFENISKLSEYIYNMKVHAIVICPKPQEPTDEKWIDSIDENGQKLKKMISILKKNGYRNICESEFYAINCVVK